MSESIGQKSLDGAFDSARSELRAAIAEEFVSKLPNALRMPELCRFLDIGPEQLHALTDRGLIVLDSAGLEPVFRPEQNLELLSGEFLFKLRPSNTRDGVGTVGW